MKSLRLLLFLVALPLVAEDTTGWYVVRAGDTLEGITARYLGSPALWRENWKLNPQVKDPNRLVPGQRLRVILSRTLPARSALVERVARRVEKKPERDAWLRARAGDRIVQREGVHTFESSSAELHFDDDTLLTLTENSLVFLRDVKAITPRRDRSEIEIVEGHADLEKPVKSKRAHDIEISIGTVTAQPAGDGARARFRNANTAAQVMSYRGGTTVASAGAKVTVREGMGVAVKPGEKPPEPEKLLAAPALRARDVSVPRPRFEWPAVRGAASYAVEICRDRTCGDLIARATGVRATEWTPTEPLTAGEFFWRVTSAADSGLDGYPATPQPLVVRLGIAGSVRGFEGANVTLHRDGVQVSTARTDRDGGFGFANLAPGAYTIVVDSRSIRTDAWAEQTDGPAGAICGGLALDKAGPCPGGRSDAADDASSLATAEHVANVTVGDAPIDGVDFGFSFDAVTSPRAKGQGSLRQFIENANAIAGPNAMRFLPHTRPAGKWWTLPASGLPRVTDAIVIDGRAPVDLNEGEIGSVSRVGAAALTLRNPDRPELLLDFDGVNEGLASDAEMTIRNIALDHATTLVHSRAPLVIENAVLGAPLHGLMPRATNATAVEAPTVRLRRVLVEAMSHRGIVADRVDAEDLEVRRCGIGDAEGAGIVARGASRFVRSLLLVNHANAIELAAGSVVEQSTFRANATALLVSGESNRVAGNRFEDNVKGIVLRAPRAELAANAFAPSDRAGIDGGTLAPPSVTNVTRSAGGFMKVSGTADGTSIDVFAGDDELTRVDTIPVSDGRFTFSSGWETFALVARDERGNTSPMTAPVNRRRIQP